MLTNAYETQVVQSLGVRIGPDRPARQRRAASGNCPFTAMRPGKCPFSAMIPGERRGGPARPASRSPSGGPPRRKRGSRTFPRSSGPMARTGIERFAREKGVLEVDEKILDDAREFFGM